MSKNEDEILEQREELVELFEQFQDLLAPSQKQALNLYLIEDLSISEIAIELNVSRSAVFDAIKKGKAKLLSIASKIQNS